MKYRSGIVKLSTIEKHDRLDAEFYLGVEAEEEFKKAKAHAVKTFRVTGMRLLRSAWGTIVGRIRHYYWRATGEVVTRITPKTPPPPPVSDVEKSGVEMESAGWSKCPICQMLWLVTVVRDCMLPACGCYGGDTSEKNKNRPCEPCGIRHAMECKEMPDEMPQLQ